MVQEEIQERTELRTTRNLVSNSSSWISRNLKFLFLPKYRLNQLKPDIINKMDYIKKRHNRNWLKSPLTIVGIVIISIIGSIAVFDSWIAPYSYKDAAFAYFIDDWWKPPSHRHPLGTGLAGQDILSRIIYGTRYSLIIAFTAVSISLVFGIALGMVSGYYGGWVDTFIMRIIDIILAFPGLVFAMAILAIWQSSIEKMIIILGIIGIPYYARLMRSSVMKTKEFEYISAAKVVGASNQRIMFRHILPNSFDPILISISFDIGRLIISIAILSFLGFGDYRYILWGDRIIDAAYNMWNAPWASFWPSAMIITTALGFMLLGDGLRDALDPRYQYKSI